MNFTRNKRIGGICMNMKSKILLNALMTVLSFCILNACDDPLEGTVYRTSDEPMLDEYMEDPANRLTEFLKIVDMSDYRGMLHAYGSYTCLVPTNDAVQKYMGELGKTVGQLTPMEANEFVGYHVISDTISSSRLVDGRMPSENIIHYYLTTEIKSDESGEVYVVVDRKARMLKKDVILGNGILHVIDAMLEKPKKTLKQQIDGLSLERYSIMKDLFVGTELYEKVLDAKVEGDTCYTVYLQNNETFYEEGIHNRTELLARLKTNTPGVEDEEELINNFLAYHVGIGRQYIVDLMLASSISTLTEPEVISCKMLKDKIWLNQFEDEAGILLDRNSEYADMGCSNGVLQEVGGMLEIKKRAPYRVYFDVAEQPEIKALSGFRKAGTTVSLLGSGGIPLSEVAIAKGSVSYKVNSNYDPKNPVAGDKDQYIYGDFLQFRMKSGYAKWIEFKLPLLIQGVYKVWACYQFTTTDKNAPQIRTTFKQVFNEEREDDLVLPNIVTMSRLTYKYINNTTKEVDHAAMEQEGMKQYNPYKNYYTMCSRLLGTIKVNTTGRYALRLESMKDAGADIMLDMIQFIPVDEDQIWPMMDMGGNLIYSDTPKEEIWPYTK